MEYQGPSQYEVIEKIGTGGLGSVYLARHKNLNTKVVLKAEKLKKKINEVQLRREVDILKTLKSPYIPVVYDYFVQGDTAYTVMEYIEGETLEEYLERGESYRQPQIIKWAIQILEALRYLHSPTHGDPPRGYIHSDIKPANIMIRPNGDISLIDFNVSLAIGEESTIGLTRGYASPEHYGYVYTDGGIKTHRLIDEDGEERTDTIGTWQTWEGEERTDTTGTWQTWDGEERTDTTGTWQTGEGERKETEGLSSTVPDDSRARGTSDRVQSSSGGGSLKRRKIAPDERSDLYSVGALLYHLVSGQKPAANVLDVVPLSPPKYNGQIAAIIGKAMNANPNRRYQSAGEMLSAFYDLKRNDARNKALKKQSVIAAALTGVLLAAGAVCAFIGLRRMQKKEEWLKLTEYSNEAYAAGDIENAIRYALEACPQGKSILTPAIREQTQVALTQALEVYKLSDGYRVDRIAKLPSEPLYADISPDGKYAACICLGQLVIVDTGNSEIVQTLEAEESALAEVKFVDSDTVLFAGRDGLTAYDLKEKKELWTGGRATGIALSGDGKKAAGIYKDDRECSLYDVQTGRLIQTVDLGNSYQPVTVNNIGFNPNDNMLALNEDGSRLGISLDKGTVKVYDLKDDSNTIEIYDEEARFGHFEGAFYQDLFLFAGSDEERAEIVVIDLPGREIVYNRADFGQFRIAAGEDGIWVSRDNRIMKYNPDSKDLEQYFSCDSLIRGISDCGEKIIAVTDAEIVTMDKDGAVLSRSERRDSTDVISVSEAAMLIGNYNSDVLQILRASDRSDTICAVYDPSYPHFETRISADQSHLLLSTERDFSVYWLDGRRVIHKELPDPDQIYDQQYIRQGQDSVLEITYNDGTVDLYDGLTGKKTGSEKREVPDKTLHETLETEHFIVENRIHQRPVVYDRESQRQVAVIEEDAYLTYADEADGCLVLRFVTTDLEQYGCLYDRNCRILARLPYLCDVYDGKLFFDYQDGAVRETAVLSLEELMEYAKSKLP